MTEAQEHTPTGQLRKTIKTTGSVHHPEYVTPEYLIFRADDNA